MSEEWLSGPRANYVPGYGAESRPCNACGVRILGTSRSDAAQAIASHERGCPAVPRHPPLGYAVLLAPEAEAWEHYALTGRTY